MTHRRSLVQKPGGSQQLAVRVCKALRSGEFRVAYQPIANARTSEIITVECLLRWQHPEYGLLLPCNFFEAFQDTQVARQSTWFVLETVCRELAECRQLGLPMPKVAINIQPSQLVDDDLPLKIESTASQRNIDPSLIQLEIVESEESAALLSTSEFTQPLKQLGVGLALDDFGTGYSSLSTLHTQQVNSVKLAGQFIRHLPDDRRSKIVVDAILEMAGELGLSVVVEGVERKEQLLWLAAHPDVLVQGNYICSPRGRLTEALSPHDTF
jgi:EAL domain-containing protein (putative c-di-GMP-specific phosphodiesterase class I)